MDSITAKHWRPLDIPHAVTSCHSCLVHSPGPDALPPRCAYLGKRDTHACCVPSLNTSCVWREGTGTKGATGAPVNACSRHAATADTPVTSMCVPGSVCQHRQRGGKTQPAPPAKCLVHRPVMIQTRTVKQPIPTADGGAMPAPTYCLACLFSLKPTTKGTKPAAMHAAAR